MPCKLWTEQASRILVRMWASGWVQQLFKLFCCGASGQVGTEDTEWSLWTGVGAVCPAQTRRSNGILQEQPELTALKWAWWPTRMCMYHEGKKYFFHWWRSMFDPEGRADWPLLQHLWGETTVTGTLWTVDVPFWGQWHLNTNCVLETMWTMDLNAFGYTRWWKALTIASFPASSGILHGLFCSI